LLNTSPDFFRVRVRVFLESGFSSSPSPGPSPSPVRVSKYAVLIACRNISEQRRETRSVQLAILVSKRKSIFHPLTKYIMVG
jgi:hypothetical protein